MITLKDVAREAGVSPGTASDILNARKGVKYGNATVERVRATAASLGYRRDRVASALRRGSSRTVGVLVPNLGNSFYTAFLTRVMTRFRLEDYAVVIEECPPDPDPAVEREALLSLNSGKIDGLLAFTIHGSAHTELLRDLVADGLSVLVTEEGETPGGVDGFSIDYSGGVQELVREAVGFGHREIVFVGDCPWDFRPGIRHDLLTAGLADLGVAAQPRRVLHCDHSAEAARESFTRFLGECSPDSRPTLAVAINDNLALGVVRACWDAGLVVPDDLSVVGFDDTPFGALWPRGLTSVGAPLSDLADRCSNLLLARMGGLDQSPPKHLRFRSRLVLRETLSVCPSPQNTAT